MLRESSRRVGMQVAPAGSIAGCGDGCVMHLTPRLGAPGTMIAARARKSQPGQALVETGLAVALFIVVVLGMT